MTKNAPFFVVGSSRSGTTLLRLMLLGHPRLHVPPETWFMLDLVSRFPLEGPLSESQVNQVLELIVANSRWPDMDMPADLLRQRVGALPSRSLAAVIQVVYQYQLESAGKLRCGDKTPTYVQIIPQLSDLFPGSKFIHLVRDGRDVAISFVDAHFRGRAYHGSDFEWVSAIRLGTAFRNSEYAHQILEVRYEDLVSNLEPTLREICRFLGEEFHPDMLKTQKRIDAVPERERGIHTKLAKPVLTNGTAAWRSRLTTVECFLLEASLRKELEALGYELRFRNRVWRILMSPTAQMLCALAPFLDRLLPALQRRRVFPRNVYI